MAELSKKSREKVALAVFIGLVILFICVAVIYIFAGHSLNRAATSLDDTLGDMEDYTAVIFEGIEHPETSDEAGNGTSDSSSGILGFTSSSDTESSDSSITVTEPVSLEEVEESYEDKGAIVITLDLSDLEYYERGIILRKDDEAFGVCAVLETTSASYAKEQISWFAKHDVDSVIALTTDLDLLDKVTGIDIAISVSDEKDLTVGKDIGGVYCIKAPDVGSVGAVIISPSNVVSSKVVQEL